MTSPTKQDDLVRNEAIAHARALLAYIGEDPERPGLLETPKRFVAALEFHTQGLKQDPDTLFKMFHDGDDENVYDEIVLQTNIPIWSMCEHHMAPFFGVAHIGYIPKDGKVVGLSKMARVADVFARRLQVQERLTVQIANCFQKNLEARGVGVVIQCRHTCVESRGVEKHKTLTTTSAMLGAFKHNSDARSELFQLINANKNVT